MNDKYSDIRHIAYPLPGNRKRMAMIDRAAQFSPFAALVGYEDTIEETARLTDSRIELDENEKYILDLRQQQLLHFIERRPEIRVTYFVTDDLKEGGKYVTITGYLRSILPHCRTMTLVDGRVIALDDVFYLDSPIFQE